MNVFEKLENFIDSKAVEIHIVDNKVYISNYIDIIDFNNVKITIKHQNGFIDISGKNLVIGKLVDNELLVSGIISNIELR